MWCTLLVPFKLLKQQIISYSLSYNLYIKEPKADLQKYTNLCFFSSSSKYPGWLNSALTENNVPRKNHHVVWLCKNVKGFHLCASLQHASHAYSAPGDSQCTSSLCEYLKFFARRVCENWELSKIDRRVQIGWVTWIACFYQMSWICKNLYTG